MAYRPRGMGLDRELQKKIEIKYVQEDAVEVVEWIMDVLSEDGELDIEPPTGYPDDVQSKYFQEWLKNGIILCMLINKLTDSQVCKPNKRVLTATKGWLKGYESENIGMFLAAAKTYGVRECDLFQTVSLQDGMNIPQVISTLYSLGSVAQKNGFNGPTIGVSMSDENKRTFNEQKLREGRSIIGLQMGTNQVASQQGMTPYGLGRQLVHKSSD